MAFEPHADRRPLRARVRRPAITTRALSVAALLFCGSVVVLAVRGARPAAFDGRCLSAGCVAPRSNPHGVALAEAGRALPAWRLSLSGRTPVVGQGLPAGERDSACDIVTRERVVAVGDVHGAYERFVAILRQARVIDARDRWSGGRTILVQTGDVVDRGADSRRALDLLRRLEREAERAGGRVIALLGNHEVMWMLGDLRYVSAGEYAAFRTDQSQDLRERYYRALLDEETQRQRGADPGFDRDAFRKRVLDSTPLGSIELQIAFGPKGEYGSWLRTHHAVARINGIVFLHGGISPSVASLGCAGINEQIAKDLSASSASRISSPADFLMTREDGPLWYRGLALEPEPGFSQALDEILGALDARAIVVGHTPTAGNRILPRFGARVIQIDTGMLDGTFFPGGRASALEILDGKLTAIYQEGREDLAVVPDVPKM